MYINRATATIGMLCGLLGCATDQQTSAERAEGNVQKSVPLRDAGSSSEQPSRATPRAPAAASASAKADAGTAARSYPGAGFIVHEWGTNTVVVSSDGKLQRGMHHEEEDLPAFVYDRLSQGKAPGFPSLVKMETPVDYFYSDRPLKVNVSVEMPSGVLTQWYPAVRAFAPGLLSGAFGRVENVDPVLELGLPFMTQACIDKFTALSRGRLDWGEVEILARDAVVQPALRDAALDRFTWSYARDVAANPIRVSNPSAQQPGALPGTPGGAESERFLFYRGLGNFALPLEVAEWGDGVKLTNRSPWPSQGALFVLDVGAETGAFRVSDGALAPSAELVAALPTESDVLPLDQFVDALDVAMTNALLETGLYEDEAVAMVRTWRRQWFRTPGLRVLHFAPAAWIDREVPITIAPPPDTLLRVMVLRIEVLQRTMEDEDLKFAAGLGGRGKAEAERHFLALGRFAEPRLRRALETLGSVTPEAARFLAAIEHPNASFALGE